MRFITSDSSINTSNYSAKYSVPKLSAVVFSADGVIVAVGEEVLVPSGAVGRSGKNGGGIRVDESAPCGVIISAL